MPAQRSRTENWRQSLQQIIDRNGCIELAVRPPAADPAHTPADLVFRVRLLAVNDREVTIAMPNAAGHAVPLTRNAPIIASFVIGQNRWAFRTTIIAEHASPSRGGESAALVLSAPTSVDRCPRRGSARANTAGFNLPNVTCWAVLDPGTIAAAEAANRAEITRAWTQPHDASAPAKASQPMLMPEVGPPVTAQLMNLSGGGVGLLLTPDAARAIDRNPFTWLRLDLSPHLPAPLCVTVRRVHTHLDASQMIYLGCSLDFTWSPQGQRFVGDLLSRYVACLQGHKKAGEAA